MRCPECFPFWNSRKAMMRFLFSLAKSSGTKSRVSGSYSSTPASTKRYGLPCLKRVSVPQKTEQKQPPPSLPFALSLSHSHHPRHQPLHSASPSTPSTPSTPSLEPPSSLLAACTFTFHIQQHSPRLRQSSPFPPFHLTTNVYS
jgi:hypothetical protein